MSEEPKVTPEPTREEILRADLRAQLAGDAERDMGGRFVIERQPYDRFGRPTCDPMRGSGR